jgi:hypothetical protein
MVQAVNAGRVAAAKRGGGGGGGGLTNAQKYGAAIFAVLCGPALLKRFYDKPKEAVDLSAFNIVSHYETPAIDRRDSTLRIEFCAS